MILNGRYYNYVPDTWKGDIPLKNTSIEAQNGRQLETALTAAPINFTVSFMLENTPNITVGNSAVGTTNWLGVSQFADLRSYLGANGASMPILYVDPSGVTYSVFPIGQIGVEVFNPTNPEEASVEYRISLTLASIQ